MTVTIADDRSRIGHAILTLDGARDDGLSVSLQFLDKTYLGPDGGRSRRRHLFAAEPCEDGGGRRFRLGPEVTAHVLEAEIVSFADAAGEVLGSASWDGVRAPPGVGTGAPIATVDRKGVDSESTRRPIFGKPSEPPPEPIEPPIEVDDPSPPTPPPPPPPLPPPPAPPEEKIQRRRKRLPLFLAGAVAVVAVIAGAVLAGLVGWTLQPAEVHFVGPAGGPFQPATQEVHFTRAWWVRPMTFMFGNGSPVDSSGQPSWLDVRAEPETGGDWAITLSVNPAATGGLAPSTTDATLPLDFPLRRHVLPGLVATLTITAPNAPTRSRPPSGRKPRRSPPPEMRSAVDDVVCDRVAGNRFDPDHPADRGYKDEIFDLSPEEAEAGLAACDPRPDRSGPDRRFAVQRGRLLADRALRRLKAGDVDAAIRDMNEAVGIWKRGEAQGSAYAANLLGAYYKGTFNRPAHLFVTPDERLATSYWDKAMRGGSSIAQRNYAAQLLMGRGVGADPARALTLLREALDRGDLRAAGVLGVAYYKGSPPGVPLEKETGWAYVVQAQCVDRDAGTLLNQEIARGARPAGDRRTCP